MVKTMVDTVEVEQEAHPDTSGNVEGMTLVDTLFYHASKGRLSDEDVEEQVDRLSDMLAEVEAQTFGDKLGDVCSETLFDMLADMVGEVKG